ncbi:HAMP domain-containing sensor histidine kinase [Mesorhizobium sp. YIM 152430]|uniref:sensor histidine kinase n=1 Tax=Mesorhizobium sp. YIM 152430 TaxID=3031761 RepID=UPI0023DB469D|nr:HAMP domain-containing sensor histidine kinase [Mesorhizobium sp. YIM 152430]MDF1599049.1 HAMP domain-containing sensor histidine kinase [Mesorhizobium sp. YIM 152430]
MKDRETDGKAESLDRRASVALGRGLSTKLLLLTMLFVLIAEVLIFIPSIANFRLRWLEERLSTAAAVATVLVDEDASSLSRATQDDVLASLGAKAVAVRDEGMSQLLVAADMPPEIDEHVSIAATSPIAAVRDALSTALWGGNRMLRVFGPVGDSTKEFELIIPDGDLRSAMMVYARNVAILSLIISVITAGLVFWAINRMMIRPIRRMTHSMLAFSAAPDDPARVIRPDRRTDEIGIAQHELATMQGELQRTLGEQRHLAELGLAVSKINHDMRNMLAAAQLMSDRLRLIDNATVQSFVPKLVRTLDRAVSYSEGVLAYGRTQEAPPSRRRLRLAQMVDDVGEILGLAPEGDIEFVNAVDPALEVEADADHLFRVLANLARNAVQAMQTDTETAVVKRLTIGAMREGTVSKITIEDTGPGLPKRARENLFAAFRGAARSGGTGLGLAIAHELVRAHAGTLELVETRGGRTVFEICIPDQPIALDEARKSIRRPA